MQAKPTVRLLFIAAWLLLASGCGQLPERPGRAAQDPDIARAAALLQGGQYLAAAELYRQVAARTAPPAQRADYLLSAGEAARQGGDWDGVRAALEALQDLTLTGSYALRQRLLQAELLLQEMRPADALAALDGGVDPRAARDLRIRFHRTLADSYRQMGNLLESANALQAVDGLHTDPTLRLQTQTEILRMLALLNEPVLENLQPSPPGVSGGWMQLALLVKRHGSDPDDLAPLLAAWRQRFPEHPALPELLSNYQAQLQQQLQRASRIAVLLPQSGTFAGVAAAIRDGIMISRYALPEDKRPELRFYDATDPAGVWPLYSQAVADGAELVIGPLQKDSVSQLVRAGDLPVPVLALNQVELTAAPPANLFMYSLSPEDEARQAAERIWLDGKRRPAVLVPQGEWGERIAAAFESRWSALGGRVAGIGRYDGDSHDYSETITGLLRLDQSASRHQQLQGWLGRRLEFEPRRRDDVDAVFMAARPVQAQGIRPQLQFHHAADLPVYATSHAWLGQLNRSQIEDMSGIMLPDIPWLVSDNDDGDSRSSAARYLPQSGSAYGRLYAMGIDAMRLVPHLKRLQSSRFESLDGSTGNLYMDETNQVHRQLVWIRLGEELELLGYSPRLDLQGNVPATPGEPAAATSPPVN
jgi:outer membrane PBP1 activator LpoA protein